MIKIIFIIFIALLTLNALALDTGFSPASLKLKIYKFAVSTSPYCTNLITVVDNGNSPVDVEFVGGANLGSGVLADGTYPCVVIEMSDNVKFTPNGTSTSGNCQSGNESIIDICRSDNGGTSTLIDGTTVTCTGTDPGSPISNRVAMYLSTVTTGGSDTFQAPTLISTTHGLTLGSSLVVSGSSVAQFRMNADNQVQDDGVSCGLNAPAFSFSKI